MKGFWWTVWCSSSYLVILGHGWTFSDHHHHQQQQQQPWTRRTVLKSLTTTTTTAAVLVATTTLRPENAHAASDATDRMTQKKKQIGISNEELAKIIVQDIQDNQFMVRADLTRSIYDEKATFTDEIDTYQLDAWIQGTKRLFVANQSHVDLVPNSLQVNVTEATFLFTEFLTFNIPFLLPKVYLSGKVILKRDPTTGLITSYQEQWDQDVNTVLLSAKLGGGK